MGAALKAKRWPITVVVVLAFMVAGWHWGLRAQVISYGHPSKSYFQPAEGGPNGTTNLCFDDVVWHRICPSVLHMTFTPANCCDDKVKRWDSQYTISVPLKTGRVPPKCRPWKIPDVPDEGMGVGTLTGFASSECWPLDHWSPIAETLPPMKLTLKPRE